MYAHVTTYRLSTSDEVQRELDTEHRPISDQTARTIASWWHSPGAGSVNITALSHGLPFDTEALTGEIGREITDAEHAGALTEWIEYLEELLAG